MNLFFRSHLRAYSLIELLVVVAIIGIATTIMMVDWSGSRTTRSLENAGKEVEAVVRGAQNFALTGVQSLPNTRPCGFRVEWGASTYDVLYRYRNGDDCTESSPVGSYTLSGGVVFSGSGSFDFGLPHATLGADQHMILVKNGQSQSVCVYTNGRILSVAGSTCPS